MSYTRPDRTIEPFRDLSIEGFGRRSHSHRKARNIEPCVDQVRVLSSNILRDPGFEKQTADFGTGPNLADDIPHHTISATNYPLRWVDPSDADSTNDPEAGIESYWVQDYTQEDDIRWQTSAVNPRSGSRHARKLMHNRAFANGAGWDDGYMFAAQYARCGVPHQTGAESYTAAVLPGDLVTYSFYMMVNSTAASPTVTIEMYSFKSDWTDTIGWAEVVDIPLTTSYAQYSLQWVMPADSAYVICDLWPDHTILISNTIVDLDDAVVSIA